VKARKRKSKTRRARLLENAVLGLRHVGFEFYQYASDFTKISDSPLFLPKRYLRCNYPHPPLYGTKGFKEGYIFDSGTEYILEVKYQNSSGSTDEKVPYIWEHFLVSPIPNWIVWFDGAWWLNNRRGREAVQWLRERSIQAPVGRHLYVCATNDEWFDLTNRLFNSKD